MTLLLQLIQTAGKQSPILEDAFLCIGALTAALEQDFHPYLQAFLPFLISALGAHEEYALCSIAVGLIGDICRALGEASLPYCQGFMEVLLADLQSNVLHRNVKPVILSCFGDVALAVGPGFEPFLETTMGVLQQAGAMRADPVRPSSCVYPPSPPQSDSSVPRPTTSSSTTSTACAKASSRRTSASSAG